MLGVCIASSTASKFNNNNSRRVSVILPRPEAIYSYCENKCNDILTVFNTLMEISSSNE